MNHVRLGLIGLGYIGKTHLKNAQKLDNTKIVSVADTSKQALAYAKDKGVKLLYSDYTEMLKQPDLDAVIVSLPNFLHKESVDYICEEEKHILMEKPLARNPAEGKYIVDKARKHDLKLMVGYPLRFTPYLIKAKEDIDSGDFGFIQNLHAVRTGSGPYFHRDAGGYPIPVPEWWFSKEKVGGGVLLDTGCHLINLLRWYFGDIVKIHGAFGYKYGLEVEDQALCIVEFDNGTKGCLTLNWTSYYDMFKIEIFGTTSNHTIYQKPTSKPITAIQMLLGTSKFWVPYMNEIEHFSDSVLNDKNPEPSGEDGLKDLIAINNAYNNRITPFECNDVKND